jgi:hypothetical protein
MNNMSSEAPIKLQATIVIAVIVGATVVGLSVWWITKPKPPPPLDLTENAVEMDIRVEAEGVLLRYKEELFWSEDQFSAIVENQDEFSSNLIGNFSESLSTYGEREEYAVDADVEFNETGKSTVLKCVVCGAVSKSGNRYTATFFWLLKPLDLDFIDDNFEHPERGLSWQGYISAILTAINLRFPVSVPAWGQPNGHCHAHVWWES